MADTAEEHKHQPYKHGAHFTFGPNSSEQLVKRDLLVSTLRHLVHGGTFGPDDRSQLPGSFRQMTHPQDSESPHPVLQSLTQYISPASSERPSKFSYTARKGCKDTVVLGDGERAAIATLFGLTATQVAATATPCRRYTVDQSSNFEVGDVVTHCEGSEAECVPSLSAAPHRGA